MKCNHEYKIWKEYSRYCIDCRTKTESKNENKFVLAIDKEAKKWN